MSKNILVAPLNWGLGHATRCIPIIKKLEENGYQPILASDGNALLLAPAHERGCNKRIVPVRHTRNELITIRCFACCDNFLVRSIRFPEADVLHNARAEQGWFLGNESH